MFGVGFLAALRRTARGAAATAAQEGPDEQDNDEAESEGGDIDTEIGVKVGALGDNSGKQSSRVVDDCSDKLIPKLS